MLKKRIIPTLTYKNNGLVKTKSFCNPRFLGDPIQTIKVYNLRDVDEIFFSDISDAIRRPNFELIKNIFQYASMPVTIGGGIHCVDDIAKLLLAGADKVCISSAAYNDLLFIKESVELFGCQAIVIALDYVIDKGEYYILFNPGLRKIRLDIEKYITDLNSIGISEIILTCVTNEGQMSGYDLNTIKQVERFCSTGIIINGGARCYEDMLDAFSSTSIVGVSAASMFHFTEQTPKEAAKFLKRHHIQVRV